MPQPPMDSALRNTSLAVVAELLALAILRGKAKKNSQANGFRLDFGAEGSLCGTDSHNHEIAAP